MPTHGRPETAKDYPMSDTLRYFDSVIEAHREALDTWQRMRANLTANCDHHWIPAPAAADIITPTLMEGVGYAGCVSGETGQYSDMPLRLDCTRCNAHEVTSLGERCPLCAGEVAWHYGNTEKEWPHYFERRVGHFYALVHVSCACGYEAILWKWDR